MGIEKSFGVNMGMGQLPGLLECLGTLRPESWEHLWASSWGNAWPVTCYIVL